jgi:CHAT domain-containing protein
LRSLVDAGKWGTQAGIHTPSDNDFEHESYLELSLKRLLRSDLSSGKAASEFEALGREMVANHQDLWLARFLNSPQSQRANRLLSNAIEANEKGDPKQAAAAAQAAAAMFARLRNPAGLARSQYEALYALHRLEQTGQCEAESASLLPALQADAYRWLSIQTRIENSICASKANHFDVAAESIETALSEAHTYRYGTLVLRALGMQASFATAEGALQPSWSLNTQGLELFWKGNFPGERGFQFYSELELTAEKDGLWNLAAALQREAIGMLDQTDREDFKAMAHFHLAGIYEMLGNSGLAKEEFDRSYALFKDLPANSATRLFLAAPQIELAELEANNGSVDVARKRLLNLDIESKAWNNFLIKLTLERTQAAIERNLGHISQEQKHLQKAVSIGNKGYRTLSSPSQRWEWRREVEQAYRRLLDIELSTGRNQWQDFADWESYRLREMTGRPPFGEAVIKNIPARKAAQWRARRLAQSSLLTFAVFPDRTVAWLVDNRGIYEALIPVSAQELQNLMHDFYSHCSDFHYPQQKVNDEGLRLYQLLLAPLEKQLDIHRTLFIEGDGALSMLPWPALFTPKGQYLGEELAVANATGLFESVRRENNLTHKRQSEMESLIASPGAVKIGTRSYGALRKAERESDFVAQHSPGPARVLRGKEATADALRRLLPEASSFHFAGHAVSYSAGGELLVHGEMNDVALSSAEVAALDLSHLRLAVLSGCSTGVSEDPGHDPYGLVHSFLFAGARQVVASSWDIDSEATAQYMEHFYSLLDRGHDGAEAARSARMAIKTNIEWDHPYYWAAFQVFGKPD